MILANPYYLYLLLLIVPAVVWYIPQAKKTLCYASGIKQLCV